MYNKFLLVVSLLIVAFTSVLAQIPKKGLSVWFKSNEGVEHVNNKVTKWKDLSGNHHDAVVGSGMNAPTVVANELNHFPVIRFNGYDNGMNTDSLLTFPNKRGSIIVVFKINGAGKRSSAGYGTILSTYLGKGISWQVGEYSNLYLYYDGEGTEGFPLSYCSEKNWEILSLTRTTDSSFILYRMGEPKVQFNVKNNQPNVNTLKIGSNGRLEVLNGDIAEIIIYNYSLNEEEIKLVNAYLISKYKIETPPPPFKETLGFYLLCLLILIIITALITKYFSQRKLKKKLMILEKEKELELERQRISREMHDDIGAGLTQIILMSESAKRKNISSNELESIAATSRKLVNNMSEIVWSLNTENRSLQQLMGYLREQLHALLEHSNIEYSIQLPEVENKIILRNNQSRNILLITKEITNNAIKYSQATLIKIDCTLVNNNLLFEITDNGIGFDTTSVSNGNGLKNIQARIKEMNGVLEIESGDNKGTKFTYKIPL